MGTETDGCIGTWDSGIFFIGGLYSRLTLGTGFGGLYGIGAS